MLTSFMTLLVSDLATSSALYLSASTVAFSNFGKAGRLLTPSSSPAIHIISFNRKLQESELGRIRNMFAKHMFPISIKADLGETSSLQGRGIAG